MTYYEYSVIVNPHRLQDLQIFPGISRVVVSQISPDPFSLVPNVPIINMVPLRDREERTESGGLRFDDAERRDSI